MPADFQHLAAALPGYEIGDQIGRGAWGVVIAGRHRALGREVAIKQLALDTADEPEIKDRFLAEARALAQFDHPHIVRIFDFVEHEGECLLVMERLTGGTALQRVRSEDPAPPISCSWVVAVCAGLQYAHDRQILHRDVKPENLMFSGDGTLRVTDFGIAKLMGSTTRATRTGHVMGTPAYIAPEQAQGQPVSPATDVYATGTVLYELLAGRLPYDRVDSPLFALFQHVHEDHRPLSETAPQTPPPVVAVVERALARDPSERYATAAAMGLELAGAGEEAWGPVWTDELNQVLRSPLTEPLLPGAPSGSATLVSEPGELVSPAQELVPRPAPALPARVERRRRALIAAGLTIAAAAVALVVLLGGGDEPPGDPALAGLPPAPAGWPSELVVGVDFGDQALPEDSEHLRETAAADVQAYSAGFGWKQYDDTGRWAEEQAANADRGGVMPMFSYFTIGQLGPGARLDNPVAAEHADLADPQTMERYWKDARDLLVQIEAGSEGEPAALEVEPTLWAQQEAFSDSAGSQVPAIVGTSGVPVLSGIPDTLAGFAQGWVALRDRFGPGVMLGYPTADWGSGAEVVVDDLPGRKVEVSARRNVAFYRSLDAGFDYASLPATDHDAGYGRVVLGDEGASAWTPDDYARHAAWVAEWVDEAGLRMVLTSIPFGNTQMRAVDDSRFHYQDNHVETLLGDAELTALDAYRQAGVIGLIFGTGRPGATCPCDQADDGVTNPDPAAGNRGRSSLSADDDGGYWREQATRFAAEGGLGL